MSRGCISLDVPSLLQIVRAAAPKSPLMLVGHNPGLQEFGLAVLDKHQPGEAGKRASEFARKFPTAALAVIDFSIDVWEALKSGSGSLSEFIRPKALLHDSGKQ